MTNEKKKSKVKDEKEAGPNQESSGRASLGAVPAAAKSLADTDLKESDPPFESPLTALASAGSELLGHTDLNTIPCAFE